MALFAFIGPRPQQPIEGTCPVLDKHVLSQIKQARQNFVKNFSMFGQDLIACFNDNFKQNNFYKREGQLGQGTNHDHSILLLIFVGMVIARISPSFPGIDFNGVKQARQVLRIANK